MILWEISSRNIIFKDQSVKEIIEAVVNKKFRHSIPQHAPHGMKD
jgi:hypothetical protein